MRSMINTLVLLPIVATIAACGSDSTEYGYGSGEPDYVYTPDEPYQPAPPVPQTILALTGGVKTTEDDGDQILETGEETKPATNLSASIKPSCSKGIYVEWNICFVEKIDGGEVVSTDLNGEAICAFFRTDFDCVANALVHISTKCTQGAYCSYVLPPGSEPMLCGWRIMTGDAYTVDNKHIEGLTPEKLAKIGHDLLTYKPTP